MGQAQEKPSMTPSIRARLVRELRLFASLSVLPQHCPLRGPDGSVAIERLPWCGVE